MILSRRLIITAVATFAFATPALAAEHAPFTQAGFEAAQKAGQPILVEISAPWCPTCKAQKPILSKLYDEPKFAKLKVFEVDFDTQKDVVKEFKATMQSTLIVYKGAAEQGRSVGDTKADSIAALVNKSV